MGKLATLNSIGITGVNVFGLCPEGTGADLEVRSFAPGDGTLKIRCAAAVTGALLRSSAETTFSTCAHTLPVRAAVLAETAVSRSNLTTTRSGSVDMP